MGRDKNLSESLRYIYDNFGVETFLNEKVVYSVLSDLIPSEKMEINWVIDAINIGAFKPLVEAEKQNLDREGNKEKARRIFEANEISEARINYLLNCFFYGLKWTDKMVSMQEIKAQEKKADSENTNKNIKKQRKRTKNETVNNQNTNSDISSKKTVNNKPKLTKDKIQKIEYEYDTLYNSIDSFIQSNRSSILKLKTSKMLAFGFANLLVFIGCIIMMASYLFVLKEGYVYKRVLILDIIGFIVGINILIKTFNNLRNLKIESSKKKIYNSFINLKGAVDLRRDKIKLGSVLNFNSYKEMSEVAQGYKSQFEHLKNKWINVPYAKYNKNTKIAKIVIAFFIIFVISGVYESRLVYDHNTIFHIISRSIVDAVDSKIYDQEFACVKADLANVRRKADKDSESIRKVEKYETLNLTGKSYEKDDKIWYETNIGNKKGWISGSVINVVPKQLTVTEEAANIRTRASLDSSVYTYVKRGDILYTTGKAIDKGERIWYEIYMNGEDGYWVSSNVVE